MTDTTRIDLDAIRARVAAATAGPWFWYGEGSTQRIDLARKAPGYGWDVVMGFSRWGMQRAQPVFSDHGLLTAARERLVYQVAPDAISADDTRVYRQTIIGIRHPDAIFIAAARQDVDDLLAYIDDLHERLERTP